MKEYFEKYYRKIISAVKLRKMRKNRRPANKCKFGKKIIYNNSIDTFLRLN